MKSLTYSKLVALALVITLLFSCQKDEFLDTTPESETTEKPINQTAEDDVLPQIKLGEKLENPYSVTNMRLAYESLKRKIAIAATTSSSSVGLGEAWGNHIGHFLTIQEFGNNNKVLSLDAFENFDPLKRTNKVSKGYYTSRTGWTGWMPCGIMHDLIDENTDLVRIDHIDNASGYSIRNIYDALDKDIETPQAFRDRLLRENNNKDEDDVRELFDAYYWD